MRWVSAGIVITFMMTGCSDSESPAPADSSKTQSSSEQASQAQASAASPGFDSPQAAFDAVKAAAVNNDIPGTIRCMSSRSQKQMAEIMMLPLTMIAAFDPKKKQEVTSLFSRHGISFSDDSEEFPIDNIPDRVAFIADVMNWMDINANADDGESSPIVMLAEATLSDVVINGDSAHGITTFNDGETEDFEFVRVDGRWFIELPDAVSENGSMAGSRGAFNSGFAERFGVEDTPPLPIEVITPEEFAAAWQVTVRQADVPARDLLSRLADELGLQLVVDPAESAVDQPVTVDLSAVSRLEVIESVCSQINAFPVITAMSLTIEPGHRTNPVVFSGPFMLQVTSLETDAETATGLLVLQLIGGGIPPGVVRQVHNGFEKSIHIERVVTADGESLVNSRRGISWFSKNATALNGEFTIGLRNLLRSVTEIHEVELQLLITLPTQVTILSFDDLTAASKQTNGDFEISLTEFDGTSYSFEYSGGESDAIQLIAFDADGESITPFGSSRFGGGDSGTISNLYKSSPVRCEVRFVSAAEPKEYAVVLAGIPLPDHRRMPEQLPQLSFTGDLPVTLDFVRFAGDTKFREVVLSASNQSSKAIEAIRLTMYYLDVNGEVLEDHTTYWSDERIPTAGTLEFEAFAHFMPGETRSVKATVDAVEFSDGSEWIPDVH